MTNNTPDYEDNLYFDSQNTKKDLTSEQLTEQWKKGELPSGWYYVRLIRGEYRIDLYINSKNEWIDCPDNIIDTVVCEVPSFDELQNMNEAVNECMAANIKLVEQNAQLKEQINHLLKTQARQFVDNQKLQVKAEKAKDVVNIDTARQIKQLKELLKECREVIEWQTDNYDEKPLIAKIDEVLK